MIFLKRKKLFLGILGGLLLASCGTYTPPKMYTVGFYNDFQGIDYSLLPSPKETDQLVGKAYGMYGEVVAFSNLSGKSFDFKSSRTPRAGYEFVFKGWKGNYHTSELGPEYEGKPLEGDVINYYKPDTNV